MSKRAVDLTDEELVAHFRGAARSAALEAAQCGLSVYGSVKLVRDGQLDEIAPAVRLPSGEIELVPAKPDAARRKRARAA
jgi:hypothetical protein